MKKITLIKWIEFNKQCESLKLPSEGESERRKKVLTEIYLAKKAYLAYSIFEGEPEIGEIEWYDKFSSNISNYTSSLNDESRLQHLFEKIGLPSWKMNSLSKISFGQFIDSKMISQGCNEWVALQYIAAIYITSGRIKKYNNEVTNEENKKFIKCGELTFDVFYLIRLWWEKFNKYINENFTVFQDSGDSNKDSENVTEHMARWGWVKFLKDIAKTKIFDIPSMGMNSIECVRQTGCNEVLVYASEEKDFNIASYRDMKNLYEK